MTSSLIFWFSFGSQLISHTVLEPSGGLHTLPPQRRPVPWRQEELDCPPDHLPLGRLWAQQIHFRSLSHPLLTSTHVWAQWSRQHVVGCHWAASLCWLCANYLSDYDSIMCPLWATVLFGLSRSPQS